MEVENNIVDLAAHRKAGEADPDPRESSREKWLSAMEKAAFELSDDSLRGRGESGFQRPPAEFAAPVGEGDAPGLPGGYDALRGKGGPPNPPPTPQSLLATAVSAGMFVGTTTSAMPPVPGASIANPATTPGKLSPRPGSSTLPPGYSQRYEALMSQTRFMEVNIQLTQSGSGVTLWIRDFKHKYANEVFQWTRSLENLLRERGQSLARIMLNGKPIPGIESIFGGEHGD